MFEIPNLSNTLVKVIVDGLRIISFFIPFDGNIFQTILR